MFCIRTSIIYRFLCTWVVYLLLGAVIPILLYLGNKLSYVPDITNQQNLILLLLGTALFAVVISHTVSFRIPNEARKTIANNIKLELAQIRIFSLIWLILLIITNVILTEHANLSCLISLFLNAVQYAAIIYYIRRFYRIPRLQDELCNSINKERETALFSRESPISKAKSL